jgi:hypothetical protein
VYIPPVHQRDAENQSLLSALAGDGRPLLSFTGIALILSGAFALFLSASKQFLPHDVDFLGMTARDLCARNECRIVHFMFHDRVSFGGVLIGIGTLYLWLAAFPLRAGRAWAWWLFVVSGAIGFASFLAYLGYGYLDTWHGAATLVLLPLYVIGLIRSRALLTGNPSARNLLIPSMPLKPITPYSLGRFLICVTAIGLFGAGLVIMVVGMTTVFVPTDLTFMKLQPADLRAISPRLIPLIAHDRAGFGGGVACSAVLIFFCGWCAAPSHSLWQALAFAGGIGFACAIGIHPLVGYTNMIHLLPAVLGAVVYAIGIALMYPASFGHAPRSDSHPPAILAAQ